MQWGALIACYFIGAIPFGLIAGKITRGIDVRQFGSGNIGASNVLRTLGLGPALVVFFLDTAKGYVAVALCQTLGLSPWFVVGGGLLSVMGHTFSVFLRFRGGKGVATSLGVVVGLNWMVAAVAFCIWAVLVLLTRYISVGSVVAAISVPVMMHTWKPGGEAVAAPYQILVSVAALAIVLRHISNIKRLLAGKENRIGHKVMMNERRESTQTDR